MEKIWQDWIHFTSAYLECEERFFTFSYGSSSEDSLHILGLMGDLS